MSLMFRPGRASMIGSMVTGIMMLVLVYSLMVDRMGTLIIIYIALI